ncbi:glycosyl hydrolase family 28 protein [Marinilabilia sp.]|uniref:glycoside hydrolase family 28 protein n=1 Tax=Marinilabilia sp. TaxID=2021252 RepID=UPI0025BE57DE|nr:glycosyl hydrolase family 28 protein [Marinilabilia sp.]
MKNLKSVLISFSLILLMSCQVATNNEILFNIVDYGAMADGVTDNALAIKKAIDACVQSGGGKVVIPGDGVFLSGPFDLASEMELHVEAGAVLLANPDTSEYTKSAFRENPGEGTIWIGGENLHDVAITGLGVIDGNGIKFMGEELEDSYELLPFEVKDPRPHVLTLVNVHNLRIENVTFRHSAYWTVHLIGCDDGVINGITIDNSLKIRNSDGIDLDHSKNIRISNCNIKSGDDSICLKNRREFKEYGNCENIVVTNCLMSSRSCAFKIGSENMDTIQNVTVNNCTILASNRGIGIQNRDEGVVQNVLFSNIIVESRFFSDVWWGKSEPIYVTAYRRANIDHKDASWRFPEGATEGFVGQVNDITFQNIQCRSENGIYVSAESKDKINHILFDGVSVVLNRVTDYEGGIYDRRPCEGEGLVKAKTSAFFIDNANDVQVRDCDIRLGANPPLNMGDLIHRTNTSIPGTKIR